MKHFDEFLCSHKVSTCFALDTKQIEIVGNKLIEEKAQKITYPVEVVELLSLDKLWKLLLVSV